MAHIANQHAAKGHREEYRQTLDNGLRPTPRVPHQGVYSILCRTEVTNNPDIVYSQGGSGQLLMSLGYLRYSGDG